MKYELLPTNGRKSFYGKAIVTENNGEKVLTSYQTEVAKIDNKGHFIKLWNDYSATTLNHINAFRIMYDLKPITKNQWNNMETEKAIVP